MLKCDFLRGKKPQFIYDRESPPPIDVTMEEIRDMEANLKKEIDDGLKAERADLDAKLRSLEQSDATAWANFKDDYKETLQGKDRNDWRKVTVFQKKWWEKYEASKAAPEVRTPVQELLHTYNVDREHWQAFQEAAAEARPAETETGEGSLLRKYAVFYGVRRSNYDFTRKEEWIRMMNDFDAHGYDDPATYESEPTPVAVEAEPLPADEADEELSEEEQALADTLEPAEKATEQFKARVEKAAGEMTGKLMDLEDQTPEEQARLLAEAYEEMAALYADFGGLLKTVEQTMKGVHQFLDTGELILTRDDAGFWEAELLELKYELSDDINETLIGMYKTLEETNQAFAEREGFGPESTIGMSIESTRGKMLQDITALFNNEAKKTLDQIARAADRMYGCVPVDVEVAKAG